MLGMLVMCKPVSVDASSTIGNWRQILLGLLMRGNLMTMLGPLWASVM